jgi:uncharacterized protein (TIGR02246 family)
MKKPIIFHLLLALLFLTVSTNKTNAQKLNKDALNFVKTYQNNYNSGNLTALMDLYSDEVTVVYSDTTEKVPKSYFEKDYIRDFGEAAGTHFELKVNNTEMLSDGKIKITGSFDGYDFDRKSSTKLNPTIGNFENIIVKEGGKWKFSQIKTEFAIEKIYHDVRKLVQNFQDAYNNKDADQIGTLFTPNSKKITAHGKVSNGAENIKNEYAEVFKTTNAALTLKIANIQPQFDGSLISTGTYSVYGNDANGNRIASNGSYMNKLVNENGNWKLDEVKLGNIIKVIVSHKTNDFAKWKANFNEFRRVRRDAGELSFEISTLADDPNTVYVISEWPSIEKAKAFFALPELEEHRKKIGETEPLNIKYLDKK